MKSPIDIVQKLAKNYVSKEKNFKKRMIVGTKELLIDGIQIAKKNNNSEINQKH